MAEAQDATAQGGSLTRDRILREAVSLADREGLPGGEVAPCGPPKREPGPQACLKAYGGGYQETAPEEYKPRERSQGTGKGQTCALSEEKGGCRPSTTLLWRRAASTRA